MGSHHVAVPRSMRRAAGEFPCRPGLFVEWTRYNDLPRLAMPESVLPLANPAMHSIRASSRWPRHAAIEERSFSFREAAPLSPVWPRALGSHLRSAMARGATARPLRKQIERPLRVLPGCGATGRAGRHVGPPVFDHFNWGSAAADQLGLGMGLSEWDLNRRKCGCISVRVFRA